MGRSSDGICRRLTTAIFLWRACVVLMVALVCVLPLAAQKKQKEKPLKDAPLGIQTTANLPDLDVIDTGISEMLAAWQVGDVRLLHKHYADDVTVVSGLYEPPVQGWDNYLQAYQRQRERVEQLRLDRFNTFLRVKGTMAWATYQWQFSAIVDNKVSGARGHTTLLLEKRGNDWVIVHNHTSVAEQMDMKPAAPAAPAQKPGL